VSLGERFPMTQSRPSRLVSAATLTPGPHISQEKCLFWYL
jgi:hypothetical protein